jgi:hypothetical protein
MYLIIIIIIYIRVDYFLNYTNFIVKDCKCTYVCTNIKQLYSQPYFQSV